MSVPTAITYAPSAGPAPWPHPCRHGQSESAQPEFVNGLLGLPIPTAPEERGMDDPTRAGSHDRRRFLTKGLAAGLAAASSLPRRAEAGGPALTVLGDSYSSTNWPFPTWPEQLVRAGRASSLRDYAVPGATAADGSNSFASQL